MSSRSSSISPQPFLHSGDGVPQGQQEGSLPCPAARAAQAYPPAAQDEGPWQEVRKSRRKAARQQAASLATVRKAPTQDGAAPDQDMPPSLSRAVQAAAQREEQLLPRSEEAAVPPHAQSASEAAEYMAGSRPQKSSQRKGPDPVLHLRPQTLPSSLKHEPLQASSAHVQVRIMARAHLLSYCFFKRCQTSHSPVVGFPAPWVLAECECAQLVCLLVALEK